MDGTHVLVWLLFGLVFLLGVAALAWNPVRRALARRTRRRYYRRLAAESRPQRLSGLPGVPPTTVTAERAAAIRRHAERSAAWHCLAGAPEASSPYPAGTQEHMLWLTTYHLAIAELRDKDDSPLPPRPRAAARSQTEPTTER